MKLLTCLVILLSFSMAVVAQPTDESESAEKKSPSRFDIAPAVPQILEEDLEASCVLRENSSFCFPHDGRQAARVCGNHHLPSAHRRRP